MTGPVAQLLTLVSYGHEFLKTGVAEPNFYPGNSSFIFCNKLSFTGIKKSWFSNGKVVEVGNDPIEWFRFLKNDNCRELRAYFQTSKTNDKYKDRYLAGFVGGGGDWLIEGIYKNHSVFWHPEWEVTKKDDPENRIWSVNYRVVLSQETIAQEFFLEPIKTELRSVLSDIGTFANQHGYENFGECFNKALEVLDSPNPLPPPFASDFILTRLYSLTALQLIFAAGYAWVFGGMGSWNDIGFQDEKDRQLYEDLSDKLYDLVIAALVAGINS